MLIHRLVHVLPVAALLAALCPAQSSLRIYSTGDTIIGVGGVTSFEDIAAEESGTNWRFWSKIHTTASSNDLVMVFNGPVLMREGALLNTPPGATVSDFIGFHGRPGCDSPAGILGLQGASITTSNDRGLFTAAILLRQEGDVSSAPQLPSGTTYGVLLGSRFNASHQALVLARMEFDSNRTGLESAVVRFDLPSADCSSPTNQFTEQVLAKTGDSIAGASGVLTGFATSEKRSFDLNSKGDYVFVGVFNDSLLARKVVLNHVAVLSEQQALPGGSGLVQGLGTAAVDLNDFGDVVVQTNTTAGAAILKGSTTSSSSLTKFIQVGDPVPDPSVGSSFVMTKIGHIQDSGAQSWAPVLVTNSGDVIWYGEWSDSDTTQNTGIFINGRVLVRKGSQQDGRTIFSLGSNGLNLRSELDVSANGRFMIYEATTSSSGLGQSIFLMDLGESVPYGTIVEGCTYPYPNPNLDHVSTLVMAGLPGQTQGGLPIVGETFHVTVDTAPVNATSIWLVFRSDPNANYPCGAPLFGFELLVGSGVQGQFVHSPASGPIAPWSFAIGPVPSFLQNQVSYAQAFFKDASGAFVGATNAIRFVYGAP